MATLPRHHAFAVRPNHHHAHGDDAEAKSNFRRVDVEQRITESEETDGAVMTRTITVSTGWDAAQRAAGIPEDELYDDEKVKRDVGSQYKIVIWHDDGRSMENVCVEVVGERTREKADEARRATVVWVPVDAAAKTTIEVRYGV